MMIDTCSLCGKPLANYSTIWAAEGLLYCSRKCGIEACTATYGKLAEEHFSMVSEELNPADIGIVPTDYNLRGGI